MRRLSRVVPALALGLILALALSGCIHEDRSVSLNSDGSGTYTLALGLSDQVLALGGDQIGASMDQIGAQVKHEGGNYSKHDDGSYTVWTFTRPFKSVADLNTLLQRPLTASSVGGTAPPPASADSFNVSVSSGFFIKSFHVTGHMSMLTPNDHPANPGGVGVPQVLKDMRESFAITMPGWISAHSGGTVSGNTITYTIHYGQQTSIDVTGGALTGAGIASIAGGVVLLLIVIAGVVLLLMRGRGFRRAAQPVPAFAVGAVPYSPLSAPAYPPDAPTLASSFSTPVPPPAPPADQPSSGPFSPDAPTVQD